MCVGVRKQQRESKERVKFLHLVTEVWRQSGDPLVLSEFGSSSVARVDVPVVNATDAHLVLAAPLEVKTDLTPSCGPHRAKFLFFFFFFFCK